jgi:hypothetical protein
MTSQVIATCFYSIHSQFVNTLKYFSYKQNYRVLQIYLVGKYFQVSMSWQFSSTFGYFRLHFWYNSAECSASSWHLKLTFNPLKVK